MDLKKALIRKGVNPDLIRNVDVYWDAEKQAYRVTGVLVLQFGREELDE